MQIKINDCTIDVQVPDEQVIAALTSILYPQVEVEPVEELESLHLLLAKDYLRDLAAALHE